MKGVKAFNKGMICQNFQFEENKVFETEEAIKPCNSGFHFCSEENALSVLNYYSPMSEFAEVEAEGDCVSHEDKEVTNKLRVKGKVSLAHLFKLQFSFIREKCLSSSESNTSGYKAHANTSGDYAHANTSGREAHANTSGREAHANTSGDYAHANTSGYKAHANTSGSESISVAIGVQGRAKAEKGWIIITDWQYQDEWVIKNIYTAKVGKKIKGVVIEPTKYYWFEDGQLKSE